VPIHGIGQGNGAGPAIWTVVSTPLLNLLREKVTAVKWSVPFQVLTFGL